jgi:hypothetical protein
LLEGIGLAIADNDTPVNLRDGRKQTLCLAVLAAALALETAAVLVSICASAGHNSSQSGSRSFGAFCNRKRDLGAMTGAVLCAPVRDSDVT